jgi:hypothetical protein
MMATDLESPGVLGPGLNRSVKKESRPVERCLRSVLTQPANSHSWVIDACSAVFRENPGAPRSTRALRCGCSVVPVRVQRQVLHAPRL